MLLRFILFGALCTFYNTEAALTFANDEDLLQYIRTESFVIALFTRQDCDPCDEFEQELLNLRKDLLDALGASVLKVPDSQMLRLYSPNKEPTLIFFRNGNPLLYDGPISEDAIYHTLIGNQQPVVRELTDDNFERLTQASSGATTGDWFVMFYSTDCVDCQRMEAQWEAVGSKLQQRVNVARVNKYTTGASTAKRFNVFDVPEFILFRQGKMYRYQIPKYDVNSLVSFAEDWWKNAHGEKIPVPQSPFDDLTQMCANFLRENPWLMKLGSIIICVLVIVSVASKLRRKAEAPLKKES